MRKIFIFIFILSSNTALASIEKPQDQNGRATELAKLLVYKVHVHGAAGLPSRGYKLSKILADRNKDGGLGETRTLIPRGTRP